MEIQGNTAQLEAPAPIIIRQESTLTTFQFRAALSAILVLGLLIRIYHFHWMMGGDDQVWVTTARHFLKPETDLPPIYYARIIYSAMLYLWCSLFGFSLYAAGLLMFVLSVTTTILLAKVGSLAFSPRVGLLSALFYATHPLTAVQDVINVPDNLANLLLIASLLFLLRFYIKRNSIDLALSGVLTGISFSPKEYYILAAAPIFFLLLIDHPTGKRLRNALTYSVWVTLGVSVDFLLHLYQSGHPLAHLTSVSDYPERLGAFLSYASGTELLARTLVARMEYFDWLTMRYGPTHCGLTILGTCYIFYQSRHDRRYRLLLSLLLVFFTFLLFMPTKLNPLTFVEMQPRYLIVLLPMISLGVGASIADAMSATQISRLRPAVWTALAIGLAASICVPNDFANTAFRRGKIQEMLGLERFVAHAPDFGVKELVFDSEYRRRLPDSLGSNLKLTFFDFQNPSSAVKITEYLRSDQARALYLPRSEFTWPLAASLKHGDYDPAMESEQKYRSAIDQMRSQQFVRKDISVPDTVLMEWLARFNLVRGEQQLIGWIWHSQQSF